MTEQIRILNIENYTQEIINGDLILTPKNIHKSEESTIPQITHSTIGDCAIIKEKSAAERFYQNHIKRVCDYQKANPEKIREKCKKWNAKVKEENPEKYEQILEKKRKYYMEVTKPKLLAIKSAKGSN